MFRGCGMFALAMFRGCGMFASAMSRGAATLTYVCEALACSLLVVRLSYVKNREEPLFPSHSEEQIGEETREIDEYMLSHDIVI